MNRLNSKFVTSLVVWYGLYQLIHIGVNVRGLLQLARGGIDFPAMPPPGGWTVQVIYFFSGMASIDLLNAVLTLVFVIGYFRRTRWHFWLGTLTLAISMYAAVLFDYATVASGAWTGANLPGYLFINVAFLPVVWLFVLVCVWGIRGELQ
jgi:hypothetical protein